MFSLKINEVENIHVCAPLGQSSCNDDFDFVGRDCGLDINNCIFNMKEKTDSIGGINVSDRLKYLGITVDAKRNCFQIQKVEMKQKARKPANLTFNIIAKSCSKMFIGKIYCKAVALPLILHRVNIMNITKTDIDKLQKTENEVPVDR